MEYVLDSSLALSWYFEDETSPLSEKLFLAVHASVLHVPPIWKIEVCNGLLVGLNRRRLSQELFQRCLESVLKLRVAIAQPETDAELMMIIRLAQHHRLAIYDATYLELALRLGIPLATLDQRLAAAAQSEKVLLALEA
jgi:predicted nucleic acid-binding protein